MGKTDLASLQAVVRGRVQGVFFRAFVEEHARELGLTGYVRNLPDGRSLEVVAEGPSDRLEELASYLRVGPPSARVDQVVTEWSGHTGAHTGFRVRH